MILLKNKVKIYQIHIQDVIKIIKNKREVVYRKIANILSKKIKDGVYKPQTKLPSETALSIKYSVSRLTIRRALEILLNENLIIKQKGVGSFVKDTFNQRNKILSGFTQEISSRNKKPRTEVIKFQKTIAFGNLCQELEIEEGEKLYYFERIRYVNEIPYIYEKTYMPVKLFPGLKKKDMRESKYKYVENILEKKIIKNRHRVFPKMADGLLSKLLHLKKGELLLKVIDTNFLEGNIPFEYCISYFNTNNFEFILTVEK